MNILVFTTAYYPSVGGLENQTSNLLNEFLKVGHEIKVITFQEHPCTESLVGNKENQISIYYNPGFFQVFKLFFWCHVFYMPNVSLKGGWFIPFLPFKKWVISHNGFYLKDRKSTKTRMKLLLIKLASKNISVSHYVANKINTNSKIIYNCYDNDIFRILDEEERKFEFVFLGRLVSQKGCDLLIRACKKIETSYSLNIIGDGPEKSRLEKMVRDLQLERKISFLGVLEGEQLARVLNRHHIMVIPSIDTEGFGIVALEGLACGCKIIAADAGGLAEAVGGFGKLFQMGDQEQLETLLRQELENLKRPARISNEAELRNYLASQNKKAVAEEYLRIFNSNNN